MALWGCGGRHRAPLGVFAQDHPHLLLDRAAVLGRTQAQIRLDGVVELSDGQACHGGFLIEMIAMLSAT
jgi:hypothetical protein